MDVVVQLAGAKELVEFVAEVADEDMRKLIDAVEEHSDTFVHESAVADFIAMKRFIGQLLCSRDGDAQSFLLNTLPPLIDMQNSPQESLSSKLMSCNENVYSLRSLYSKVANRGEVTRDVIKNAVLRGCYRFSINENGEFETGNMLNMFQKGRGVTEYSLNQLHDYRSRALLMVNSSRSPVSQAAEGHSYEVRDYVSEFIEQVNVVTSIVELGVELGDLGHFDYVGWECVVESKSAQKGSHCSHTLESLKAKLTENLRLWQQLLFEARTAFYELNFFRAKQIRQLWSLVRKRDVSQQMKGHDLMHVIRALCPEVRPSDLFTSGAKQHMNAQDKLQVCGEWLRTLLVKKAHLRHRTIHEPERFAHLQAHVAQGQVFLALADDGTHLLNVILALYARTSFFPEAGELLICHSGTDWEDVMLLLMRCLHSAGTRHEGRLFCLAGVDALDFRLQNKLVEMLDSCFGNSGDIGDSWRLAVVVGTGCSHVLDHYGDKFHRMRGLSTEDVAQLLASLCQQQHAPISIIKSEIPGLGKSSWIRGKVFRTFVVRVPIGGPIDYKQLVNTLQRHMAIVSSSSNFGLHLDISRVSNPAVLDAFLVDLLLVNYVASGSKAFFLEQKGNPVFIELANTLGEDLTRTLPFCRCAPSMQLEKQAMFGTINLTWSLENLWVSHDINSDVQVVCNYLRAMDNKTLGSRDLVFGNNSQNVECLTAEQCRQYLHQHFLKDAPFQSFSLLSTFLAVFAWQLRSLSKSIFFTVDTQKFMVNNTQCRYLVVKSLLASAKRFAIESSSAAYMSQRNHGSSEPMPMEYQMVNRMQKLIRWEDNTHLLVLFNDADGQSISTIYKDPRHVPAEVKELLRSQRIKSSKSDAGLENFGSMSHERLMAKLELILGKSTDAIGGQPYVLTADNFMKMVLIHIRVQSNVPVLLMGETGNSALRERLY